MQRPLGAQISHMLKDRGVDVIFGIPGVHNQEMYRGLAEAGLTHVLARHEQGAGFMADGYARATGSPGVAYVITGPGITNIMTPMGQAYSDSVPLLVISSCLDETAARRGQLHQMKDQRAAAETVCDWSEVARTPEAAYALIDRALCEFVAGRRRPKAIHVPIAALEALAPNARPFGELHGLLPQPAPSDIAVLAQALRSAKKPLFIFGGGAQWIDFAGPVLRRWNVASFTTYAARGVVPPDDPLCFGSYLARPGSADVLATADLVVVFGSELSETDLWRDRLGASVPIIQVDIDPEVLAKEGPPIHADAFSVFEALSEAVPEVLKTEWKPEHVHSFRSRCRAEVDAERPGIVPVCDALRDCLPEGTMIYSDMTQFAYAAKEVWDMEQPGHWHHPTGFGTLGYATPAAIGGAVGRPGLPTMAIIGDYGFHYTMAELGVAVELGLSLPIILWDNGKLKEIEESMVRAQIAPNAVVARNPDFCKLAEAFGARTAAPKTLSQMQQAVRGAFEANGPTLIYLTPEIGSAP
ncbi:thiamine pyrophosphate-binding protein [Thalassococcus sp. S3]|uniref:thiamine pyrophosphate-binding protein n=1 Tax=Thalassococcus sp. S3 TaxID=2017482 RepID=UPI0010247E80|nr:thiamine pyrophosphate-binding protein [Thalassococcus sp. S3]QBF32719.1 acetolactate synthase isozyme1 large subunit [Thalassococcus sp. S3]